MFHLLIFLKTMTAPLLLRFTSQPNADGAAALVLGGIANAESIHVGDDFGKGVWFLTPDFVALLGVDHAKELEALGQEAVAQSLAQATANANLQANPRAKLFMPGSPRQ